MENEQLIMEIKPHLIAFMDLYAIGIYMIIVNLVAKFYLDDIASEIINFIGIGFIKIDQLSTFIWILMMILPFILMFIAKSSIKWLVSGIMIVGVSIAIRIKFGIYETTLNLIFGIIFLALINAYRKAHTYYITSERIVSKYRFIREKYREINYHCIADIIVEKSILGRILNVGTIVPVSKSGLGLGGDIAATSGRIDFVKSSLGIIAGTTINVPKGRSPNVLFGVKDPIKVKDLISKELSKHSENKILKEVSEELEKILEKVRS